MASYRSLQEILAEQGAEEVFASAREEIRRGRYVKATRLFREVLRRQPLRGESCYWLGLCLFRRRRYVEAIAAFRSAAGKGFDRPEVHSRTGDGCYQLSRWEAKTASERAELREEARSEFAKAIELSADMAFGDGALSDAYAGAARVAAEMGRTREALDFLLTAIKQDPGVLSDVASQLHPLLQPRSDCGQVLDELGAVVHASKSGWAYFGWIQLLTGVSTPLRTFEECLRGIAFYREVRDSEAVERPERESLLAEILNEIRWGFEEQTLAGDQMAERLERIAQESQSDLVWMGYARLLVRLGLKEQALMKAEAVLREGVADPDILQIASEMVGEFETGGRENLLQAAMDAVVRSGKPDVQLVWAIHLCQQEQEAAAIQVFDSSGRAEGHLYLANWFAQEGRKAEALERVELALDTAGRAGYGKDWFERIQAGFSDTAPIDDLCRVVWGLNDKDGGTDDRLRTIIDKVERLITPDWGPWALGIWAISLAELGRTQQALVRLQQALAAAEKEGEPADWRFFRIRDELKGNVELRRGVMALVLAHRHAKALASLAEAFVRSELWDDAEKVAEAWQEREPDSNRPLSALGRAYVGQRRYDRAITAFEAAIDRIPEDEEVYPLYLDAVELWENQDGAIGTILAVVREWTEGKSSSIDWSNVDRLRAKALQKIGRAIDAFQDGYDDNYYLRRVGEALNRQGLAARAASLFERYDAAMPHGLRAEDNYVWGLALAVVGQYKAAMSRFRRSIRYSPNWFFGYQERARAHFRLDQARAASAAFEIAFAKGSEFGAADPKRIRIDALVTWALGLSEAGLFEEAIARADEALAMDDDDYWALFGKAYVLAGMSAHEEAWAYYSRAVQADPTVPNAQHNIVNLLESQGLYEAARNKLAETLLIYARILPEIVRNRDPYLLRFYAEQCLLNKDEAKAEELLRIGLLLEPSNPDYHVALAKLYLGQETDGKEALAAGVRTPARLKALMHFQRAEAALNRRLKYARSMDVLLGFAGLYMVTGEFNKARGYFEEAANRLPCALRA